MDQVTRWPGHVTDDRVYSTDGWPCSPWAWQPGLAWCVSYRSGRRDEYCRRELGTPILEPTPGFEVKRSPEVRLLDYQRALCEDPEKMLEWFQRAQKYHWVKRYPRLRELITTSTRLGSKKWTARPRIAFSASSQWRQLLVFVVVQRGRFLVLRAASSRPFQAATQDLYAKSHERKKKGKRKELKINKWTRIKKLKEQFDGILAFYLVW